MKTPPCLSPMFPRKFYFLSIHPLNYSRFLAITPRVTSNAARPFASDPADFKPTIANQRTPTTKGTLASHLSTARATSFLDLQNSKIRMEAVEATLTGKYPAKEHAKRVVQYIKKKNPDATGVLYLEGQKTRMIEDNDESMPFR